MRLAFELDPQIIHHIIYSQAGSIGKAVIELLMNSVDAKANTVHLTMTREGFDCRDDGEGFANRDDVVRYFGRFGTPHTEGDATYGRFRLGRGQIMAHASTVWTSTLWRMSVDTRSMGYLTDRAGNGRAKKGLPRAMDDVGPDPIVSEPVAEESMALLSVVNANLVEAGCCPPPGNWAAVLQDALQAQKDLWVAQQAEIARSREMSEEADAMAAEWEAEVEAYDAADRAAIAVALNIDPAEIDTHALNALRNEGMESLQELWQNKPWLNHDDDAENDQHLLEWAAEMEAAEKSEAVDAFKAIDARLLYPAELAAHIQPGETQWMLDRNAAAAGFHDVEQYLAWRVTETVDADR